MSFASYRMRGWVPETWLPALSLPLTHCVTFANCRSSDYQSGTSDNTQCNPLILQVAKVRPRTLHQITKPIGDRSLHKPDSYTRAVSLHQLPLPRPQFYCVNEVVGLNDGCDNKLKASCKLRSRAQMHPTLRRRTPVLTGRRPASQEH